MSIDYDVYIGPYAEVAVTTDIITIDTCNQQPEQCPNNASGYCNVCGIEIAKRYKKRPVEIPLNWNDVREKWDDEDVFSCDFEYVNTDKDGYKRYQFSLNNESFFDKLKGKRSFDVKRDLGTIDLTSVNQQEEIELFKTTYEKELQLLSEAVNGNLEVKWGLLIRAF